MTKKFTFGSPEDANSFFYSLLDRGVMCYLSNFDDRDYSVRVINYEHFDRDMKFNIITLLDSINCKRLFQ